MRALIAICVVAAPVGGCPSGSGGGIESDVERLLPNDYDGLWQIASETGLVNVCLTILGDRVALINDCEGPATTLQDAEASFRSGDQIIWTFITVVGEQSTRHTISVFVQADGTLTGTYSLRQPGELLAVTDRIIMVPRRHRI